MQIPKSLIPSLAELEGPITLYMDKTRVVSGFAHEEDEFVASIRMLQNVVGFGISPAKFARILERD
ncbi:hypothetical protein RVW00_000782 [Enterobacter bugandensis]|nr:hypothetical protein [Enterobacter bugandensis]